MKLSIHPILKGKPDKKERPDKSVYYTMNGKYVDQGNGWMNIECDFDQAFELITVDGYATSAELINDNRKDDNYVSRQLIMVDIDDGMTIQELFNNEFYNEYGAGFYTTARHTDEAHRFRILFVTEEPVTETNIMKKIIRGLLIVFESADTSCKDASRIYYGVPNCPIKENQGKILSKEKMMCLVNMIDEIEREESKKWVQTFEPTTVDELFVDELLLRISHKVSNLRGEYDLWRTIAWSTCHALNNVSLATNLLMKYWPDKTKKEKQALKSWKSSNSPTLGTLIKLSGISKDERKLLEVQMKLRKMK